MVNRRAIGVHLDNAIDIKKNRGRNLFLPHVFLFEDIRLGAQLSKSVEGSGIDRLMTIHPRQLFLQMISENIEEIGDKHV